MWPGLNASNPGSSCTQILDSKPNAPSRDYWLQFSNGSIIEVFCDMSLFPCQLGFNEEGGTCKGKSIPALAVAIMQTVMQMSMSVQLTVTFVMLVLCA